MKPTPEGILAANTGGMWAERIELAEASDCDACGFEMDVGDRCWLLTDATGYAHYVACSKGCARELLGE